MCVCLDMTLCSHYEVFFFLFLLEYDLKLQDTLTHLTHVAPIVIPLEHGRTSQPKVGSFSPPFEKKT